MLTAGPAAGGGAALRPNPGKALVRESGGRRWARLPIPTPLVTAGDDIAQVAERCARPHLRPGDILFLSEKAVACAQGRAIPVEDIHPRPLAVLLSRFVTKTPHGIGLGIPETMEVALRECGTLRILAAAAAGAAGRLLRRRGWFYLVLGVGPPPSTAPPPTPSHSITAVWSPLRRSRTGSPGR